MEIKTLADEQHWEDAYVDIQFSKAPEDSALYKWLKAHVPTAKEGQSSFEVGIFPGTYSAVFGDFGYEINGIDRIKESQSVMRKWMESENYKVGDLFCDDFFTCKYPKKYDLVSSFGFIEHFEDFENVIDIHAKMTAEKGYVVIGVPNYRGRIQYLLKKYLDKKNLDIHYTPSMNFSKWEKVFERNDFEIIAKDYLGTFMLDIYPQKRNFLQKKVIKLINRRKYFIKKHILKGTSKHFSPYMIMIAKKR